MMVSHCDCPRAELGLHGDGAQMEVKTMLDKVAEMGGSELADSLDAGYTLPAEWYTSPVMTDAERDRVFHRCWQYVGLASQIPEHGDFLTYRAGDVPVLVVRGEDGSIRAFANVCRHRGSELVLALQGNRKSIQCHYHAWTYSLDGALRAKYEPGFEPSTFSLQPLPLESWGPFLFVNPDPLARPLDETLGELPSLVDAMGVDLNRLRCREQREYATAANWKVVVENYLECYHCPVAHPGFSALIDLNDYEVQEYENFSVQGGPVKSSAKEGRAAYTVGEGLDRGLYAYVWPNFMLNIYPGAGNVSINLILPTDVPRSLAAYQFCFVDTVADSEAREFIDFIEQVQREDIVLCESVQRGLRSGFFGQGKLMLHQERAIQHFQRLVYRFVAGE